MLDKRHGIKREETIHGYHGFQDINKCKYFLFYGSIKAPFSLLSFHAQSYLLFTTDIEVEY